MQLKIFVAQRMSSAARNLLKFSRPPLRITLSIAAAQWRRRRRQLYSAAGAKADHVVAQVNDLFEKTRVTFDQKEKKMTDIATVFLQ